MMTEAGLVQHWLKEEIGSVPQCLRPPTADRSDGIAALDLESFGGPLLVVAAGEEETPFKTKATHHILYHNLLNTDKTNLCLLQDNPFFKLISPRRQVH